MEVFEVAQAVAAIGELHLGTLGGDASFSRAMPLHRAGAGDLTYATTPEKAAGSRASVTVAPAAAGDGTEPRPAVLILASNPRLAFVRILSALFARRPLPGIHPTAVVAASATVHASATVGPYTVIDEGCALGADSVIHAHVHLYPDVKIGARVIVHSGTVIGSDGFGFERNGAGAFEKFPQIGGVTVEDDVEIGSNTSIDRGALGDTLIRRGTKIDNHCHVAHNVVVGQDVALTAHAMLAGSAAIGDGAWIAPSSCIRDGVSVGAKATVGLASLVNRDVPDGATVAGVPARPIATLRRRAEGGA